MYFSQCKTILVVMPSAKKCFGLNVWSLLLLHHHHHQPHQHQITLPLLKAFCVLAKNIEIKWYKLWTLFKNPAYFMCFCKNPYKNCSKNISTRLSNWTDLWWRKKLNFKYLALVAGSLFIKGRIVVACKQQWSMVEVFCKFGQGQKPKKNTAKISTNC